MRGTSTFEGIGVKVQMQSSITISWEVVILDCIWTLTRLDVIVKSIPQRDRKFACVMSRSCENYGIIAKTKMVIGCDASRSQPPLTSNRAKSFGDKTILCGV